MKNLRILLLVLIFTGCTKTIITPKYYVLEFIASEEQITPPVSNEVCEILPVTIAEAYAEHRIALRKRSHEITYYHYHQWAESPDINIERLIQKKLTDDGLFARISGDVWNVTPKYQLNTTVSYLEAVEGEDDLHAHISMSFELYDRVKRKVVVQYAFNRSQPLEDWDLNLMSYVISALLKDELDILSKKIRDYLIGL